MVNKKVHDSIAEKGSVLILAYYYPPMNTSGAFRPYRFAKYLPGFGYRTRVVASGTGSDEVQDNVHYTEALGSNSVRVSFAGRMAGVVQRFLLPYNEQLPWVPAAVAMARKLLAVQPVSAIFSTSPPLATQIAALLLKRRFGIPWVADFRDPLRDNPFRSRRWAGQYDAMLEHWIFSNADAIIANTDAMADLWSQRYPRRSHKIRLIWNGFDPEDGVEARPVPAFRKYRVLAHIGTLYGGRHPGALLSSLVRLLRADLLSPQQTRVQLIGPMEPQIVRVLENDYSFLCQCGCLEYHPYAISRQEATLRTAEADYLLLLDLNEHNAGVQVPAKIFDYVRIGRPILAFTAPGSPTERVLAGSGILHTCIYNHESEAQIDFKVLAFLNLPSLPQKASVWFTERFNAREQAAALAALLDRLTKPLSCGACSESTAAHRDQQRISASDNISDSTIFL